ncbi:MAG: methyltransferase [Pseudomonadota bacterium]
MTGLTEAEEISDIAFGYMGSHALFAALEFGLFSHLADGPQTVETLAERAGLAPGRCQTLVAALVALRLLVDTDGAVANAPAAQAFLVKGEKYDFGDYLRMQVGRQMLPLMAQIVPALAGRLPDGATSGYAQWFADPEEARLYSESQHAGSLGPARSLSRRLDLSSARKMLDLGGGTGAFAITLAEDNPKLQVTLIDFPNVAALGVQYIAAAGLADRIAYQTGNALDLDWPGGQDVIIMSYLLSGVPDHRHEAMFARAMQSLAPGGRLLVHDFIVDADRSGPKNTALWQLQHTAFTPEARSIDDGWLVDALAKAGFGPISVSALIPGMTKLAIAHRDPG